VGEGFNPNWVILSSKIGAAVEGFNPNWVILSSLDKVLIQTELDECSSI
jgi:hypothetical protein